MNKSNLTQPVFLTKPSEELAAIDVYAAEAGKGVLNRIEAFAKGKGIDLSAIIRGGAAAAKLMPSIMSATKAITSGNLLERVQAASGLTNMMIKGLPPGMADQFVDLYKEYGDTIVKVGEISQRIYTTDFKELSSIGSLVNDLAGEGIVLFDDQDGVAAMTLGIIQEATRHGIPDSFDAVVRNITDSDLLTKVVEGALPLGIEMGDVAMIHSIANHIGSGNLVDRMPNVISDLNARYDLVSGAEIQDLLESYYAVVDTYELINVDWRHDFRLEGVEQVLSTDALYRASDDFKSIYQAGVLDQDDPEHPDKFLWAVMQLPLPSSVDESLKNEFPLYQRRLY